MSKCVSKTPPTGPKKWDVWFYEKEDLVGGIELDSPDETEAAERPTVADTIEEAIAATIEHDIANQRKRIDLLRKADVHRSYCIAIREHGSNEPWKIFKGSARVVVVVDQVLDASNDMRDIAPWAAGASTVPESPLEIKELQAALADQLRGMYHSEPVTPLQRPEFSNGHQVDDSKAA